MKYTLWFGVLCSMALFVWSDDAQNVEDWGQTINWIYLALIPGWLLVILIYRAPRAQRKLNRSQQRRNERDAVGTRAGSDAGSQSGVHQDSEAGKLRAGVLKAGGGRV